jgi:nitrate/nitrite transporter NarK
LFALAAGWLADRYGANRLLLVYLLGGSFAALAAC